MQVGEIFVALGLSGGKKTKNELKDVKNEMVGISKRSLAAVAAIAGVSYGFKQLYDKAIQTGSGLVKFGEYTGMSAEQLQKWQYAARQSGVAAEEVESNVKSLQGAIGQMQITGEIPKMFQLIADAVDIDYSKLEDTYYLMGKLQQFAKDKRFTTAASNQALGEFLSPEMITFLRSNKLDIDSVKSGGYSDGQAKALQNIMVAASNLADKFEKSFGKVLVEVGPELVKKLTALIPVVENLTKAVLLSIGDFAEFAADPKGQLKQLGSGLTDPQVLKEMFKDLFPWTSYQLERMAVPNGTGMSMQDRLAADIERMKNGESARDIVVNQNFNFNGVNPDAKSVGRAAEGGGRKLGADLKTATKSN